MSTHMSTHMASVNISLTEEAYDYLKMLKGKEKSFSDVVLELKERSGEKKGSKEVVLKFFGALKDKGIDWEAKEKRMKEFRDSFNKRLGQRYNDRTR